MSIDTDNGDLVNLTEITDSKAYYSSVVDGPWRRAKVLRGFNASVLGTTNGQGAWAPCLGFGSGVADATVGAALAIPVVGVSASLYLAVLGDSDIILPPQANSYATRGITTHESGHYVFCNLVNEAAGAGAVAVFDALQITTLTEGKTIDPGDEARILNESSADFFAAQVVSGTNHWFATNSDKGKSMSFCNGIVPGAGGAGGGSGMGGASGAGSACLDANDNASGVNDTGARSEMKKIGTILQDAFDVIRASAPIFRPTAMPGGNLERFSS